MKVYLSVDIGCIECGEESTIRVFAKKEDAEKFNADAQRIQEANWRGQHNFYVLEAEVE